MRTRRFRASLRRSLGAPGSRLNLAGKARLASNGGRMVADGIFGAPERYPPRRRKRQPAGARRGRAPARGRGRGRRRSRTPEVVQRRLDLAGLASIGLAVYLGYVLYLGWNGG